MVALLKNIGQGILLPYYATKLRLLLIFQKPLTF